MYSLCAKKDQAHEDSIWSCAWGAQSSEEGSEHIIIGSVDDTVKVWKWKSDSLELQHTLEGHQLGIVSVDVNKEGTVAASSSLNSQIRLWDIEAGRQIKFIDAGPVDAWSICFSPDSKLILSGSHTGRVNLFSTETGKKETQLDTRGKFTLSIAYSPDGKYVACGAVDGIINVFDVTTERLLHTLEGHAMPIRGLAFSPDSTLLLTASDDCHIKVYNVQHANLIGTLSLLFDLLCYRQHANLIGTLSGHGSWVLNVAFSPDGSHFSSCSSDKTVKIWEVSTRQCVHTFNEHQDQVWCVRYSPEGSKLVSVSEDKAIHVYNTPL